MVYCGEEMLRFIVENIDKVEDELIDRIYEHVTEIVSQPAELPDLQSDHRCDLQYQ